MPVGTMSPPRHSRRSRSPRTGMPLGLAAKLKAYRASASGKPLSKAMPRPDDGKAKADFTGDPEVGAKVEGRAISPSGPSKATAKVEGRAISPSGPSKAAKATHPGGAKSKAKAAEKASGRPAPVKAAKYTKLTGLEGAWTVSRRQEQKPEMRFKVTCSFLSPDDKGSMDGMLCVNYHGEQPQDPQYVWLEMFHQSVIPVRGVFDELDGVVGAKTLEESRMRRWAIQGGWKNTTKWPPTVMWTRPLWDAGWRTGSRDEEEWTRA